MKGEGLCYKMITIKAFKIWKKRSPTLEGNRLHFLLLDLREPSRIDHVDLPGLEFGVLDPGFGDSGTGGERGEVVVRTMSTLRLGLLFLRFGLFELVPGAQEADGGHSRESPG
jgi:hypothetical protein